MTRNEYRIALLKKGFTLEKTQKGYPSRGEEDVYKHPAYTYHFYVTRIRKDNQYLYGFYTGDRNAQHLHELCPRNIEDDFRSDKVLKMWTDESFLALMEKL